MIKLTDIPTNEQLINVAKLINEELKTIRKENMSVVFELDEKLVKQIDEEYFFKNNNDSDEFIPSDEVEVLIYDIKFKFIKKQNEEKTD